MIETLSTEPARLPGFHTTVGGGGEKHEPAWYKENGTKLDYSLKSFLLLRAAPLLGILASL